MNKKLIFLDIDGTLTLPGSNEPPKSALDAVSAAQKKGHKVFLCSGRNPDMLSPLMKYGFDGAVASGGGYVFCGEKVLFDCPMDEGDFKKAMKLLEKAGVYRTIEAKDATFGDEQIAEFMGKISGGNSELIRWRKAIESNLGIRPMSEYDGRPIYKIVLICAERAQLDPVIKEMGDGYHFVIQDMAQAGCINGEMMTKSFDKGTGVRQVAAALGFDISDTVGFGDSMNDLEMIETVGCSVCMENGSEALKKISDIVCPPVDRDGLEKGFELAGLIDEKVCLLF